MKFKASLFFCGTFFFSLFLSFALTVAEETDAKRSPLLNPFLEAEH
jgi:hypothetical protein